MWKPSYASESKISFEVYKQEKREVQEGDLIRWTRTNKNLGLINPEIAMVQKIQNHTLTLQSVQQGSKGLITPGEPFSIQPNNPSFQHLDHAYAVTGYSAQGKTAPSVIIHAESFRPQLATQPAFLVAVTRAVNDLAIYTDSKSALLNSVAGNEGQKLSALQVTRIARKEQNILRKNQNTIDDHQDTRVIIKNHEMDL